MFMRKAAMHDSAARMIGNVDYQGLESCVGVEKGKSHVMHHALEFSSLAQHLSLYTVRLVLVYTAKNFQVFSELESGNAPALFPRIDSSYFSIPSGRCQVHETAYEAKVYQLLLG